jgi:hypothetical protein
MPVGVQGAADARTEARRVALAGSELLAGVDDLFTAAQSVTVAAMNEFAQFDTPLVKTFRRFPVLPSNCMFKGLHVKVNVVAACELPIAPPGMDKIQ